MLYIHFHKRSLTAPLTIGTRYEWANRFEDNWLLNSYVKSIVKELDDSEVLGNKAIQSPVLDIIPPDWLSATCKNIIMMYYNVNMVFQSSFFGNSANRLMEEISAVQDVHLYMNHMFKYTDTQVATLVDCSNKVVTGCETIQDEWIQEYDYDERMWDYGWEPGQLERLGLADKISR